MINTLKIFDELKETMEASAARKIAEVIGVVYEELKNTVTKTEFNELKEVIRELAEAQKRTEQRVEELAEAQRRTEERLTRLEAVVEELAEAQRRTEVEVRELAMAIKDTRIMVGGLSDAVGYGLEDRAIKSLPTLLRSRYEIEVDSPLVRKFVKYNGRHDEINIYGTGRKGKKILHIIGEAKARLAKRHIDDFLKLVDRLENKGIITRDRFLLVVTYSVEPEVEEYARDKGLQVIWSFEI